MLAIGRAVMAQPRLLPLDGRAGLAPILVQQTAIIAEINARAPPWCSSSRTRARHCAWRSARVLETARWRVRRRLAPTSASPRLPRRRCA
jgi:hypothetical protein